MLTKLITTQPKADTFATELYESVEGNIFPGINKATFEAFWAQHGKGIIGYAFEELEQFMATNKMNFSQLFAQAMTSMETNSAQA